MENANLIFELAKNASSLWLRQTDEEKRKMLNLLCSNFSYKDGELDIELNSPFAEMYNINKLPINTDNSMVLDDNILYLDKIKYPLLVDTRTFCIDKIKIELIKNLNEAGSFF